MIDYKVFDRLREGVQVIDHEMRYYYVNESVAKQCHLEIEDLLGNRMLDVFPHLEHTEVYQKITECFKNHQPVRMVNEFVQLDGSTGWFDLRMETVDQGVMIFSFDITEEKLLKQELSRMRIEVEDRVSERTLELEDRLRKERDLNELKTKFVSMASHQFRTPLTSIILSASLVEQYGQDIEKRERVVSHFNTIRSSANHMVSILNNFLSHDQIESDSMQYKAEHIDFYPFVDEIVNSLKPLLKRNQQMKVSITPTPCFVHLDSHIVHGIILNLLSNAIKYSPENSQVVFTAEMSDDRLRIEISDNGIGIPKSEQKNLFGKFFRASNTQNIRGTGLGLNIVKQFVELAGGNIKFKSEEGKGTLFRIELPQNMERVEKLDVQSEGVSG